MIYSITATWKGELYPLSIRRNSLEDAIKAAKAILPGCTIN
jgi:hypothetical protein